MLQLFVPTIFLVPACGACTFIPELRALYMSRSDQNRTSVGNVYRVLMAITGYQTQIFLQTRSSFCSAAWPVSGFITSLRWVFCWLFKSHSPTVRLFPDCSPHSGQLVTACYWLSRPPCSAQSPINSRLLCVKCLSAAVITFCWHTDFLITESELVVKWHTDNIGTDNSPTYNNLNLRLGAVTIDKRIRTDCLTDWLSVD